MLTKELPWYKKDILSLIINNSSWGLWEQSSFLHPRGWLQKFMGSIRALGLIYVGTGVISSVLEAFVLIYNLYFFIATCQPRHKSGHS